MAMYLTQVITAPTKFWLIGNKVDHNGHRYTAGNTDENIKTLFSDMSSTLYPWIVDNEYVYDTEGSKIDKVLLILPDDCTYEQFIELHPEFFI